MPKVLVVDDSLSVRKVVEKALAGRSVEVLSAASGTEAIEKIERERPDLVVCDVILPDKDGYQVCRFVREHPAVGRIPVLLISGIVNSTVLARAAEVQSNDVMFKPFAAEELVRKIDAMLAPRNGSHAPITLNVPPTATSPFARRPAATATPTVPPTATVSEATPVAPSAAAAPTPAPAAMPAQPAATTAPTVMPAGPAATTAPTVRPAAPAVTSVPVAAASARPPLTPEPTPVVSEPAPPTDATLKGQLTALAATPGVGFVALADREGFIIESAGESSGVAEVASALASCLAESSNGLGRELGRGALLGSILEYENGVVLLHGVGTTALLAVLLTDAAVLGKARYFIKKALPELERAL
jgi:CheY-like chemotaxis protein/predicted regulator of Ras-like GTPase activity (Roadblock/LC7/MglB family)